MTTIGSAADTAGLIGGLPIDMATDSRGLLYLVDGRNPTTIMVFGPDGSYRTKLGRPGEGPGEFKRITHFYIYDDTLHAFDRGTGRETVLSLTGSYVRGRPVQGIIDAALRGRGQGLLVNALVSSPEQIGLPLHWIDSDGRVVTSFGSDGTFVARQPLRMQRSLARTSDGYWSAAPFEYVLSEWDEGGKLKRSLRRRANWFQPWEPTRPEFSPRELPKPVLTALCTLPDGHLITVSLVGATDWASAIGEPIQTEVGPRYPSAVAPRAWDTMLEVVDPRLGRVLVSERVDPQLFGCFGKGMAYSYSEAGEGVPIVKVWRFGWTAG